MYSIDGGLDQYRAMVEKEMILSWVWWKSTKHLGRNPRKEICENFTMTSLANFASLHQFQTVIITNPKRLLSFLTIQESILRIVYVLYYKIQIATLSLNYQVIYLRFCQWIKELFALLDTSYYYLGCQECYVKTLIFSGKFKTSTEQFDIFVQ